MKKFLLIISVLLFVISGCAASDSQEPGNAYPTMAQYNGELYVFHGKTADEIPEGFEYLGEINCVDTHSIANDLDGNEEGRLYKNSAQPDILCYEYIEWDEQLNGKKAPILFLERDEE